MATSIASGALKPKVAVALSASLNLVGAFLSTAVAATIAKGLVDADLRHPRAGVRRTRRRHRLEPADLAAGHPVQLVARADRRHRRRHARRGRRARRDLEGPGLHGRHPGHAGAAGRRAGRHRRAPGWSTGPPRGVPEERTDTGFRYGQIGSASLVSLAHGTNDAQKTMGIIFLALISYGAASKHRHHAAALGDLLLRAGHRPRHLPRRLAGHPHAGQGPGRDQVPAGHGGGVPLRPRSSCCPATSATRCPPPTSPPARSWAAASASPAPRCAGASRAGWPPHG